MRESTSRSPIMVFRVVDRDGQPIGEIMHPTVAPVVGRGAKTVLLVRGEPVNQPLKTISC
jgi:hypothetical protein